MGHANVSHKEGLRKDNIISARPSQHVGRGYQPSHKSSLGRVELKALLFEAGGPRNSEEYANSCEHPSKVALPPLSRLRK